MAKAGFTVISSAGCRVKLAVVEIMVWSAISIQPRKVTPLAAVATTVVPSLETVTASPLLTALPPTVTPPRALSKSKVTLDSLFNCVSAKLLITNLLVVLFFAVVMVTVKPSPASKTLLKLPEAPLYCVPSILSWLTDVAVQSKESVAVASESLYMVMVAVFAEAPKPRTPAEPFAVTVTAPLDMLLSVAPLTPTVTPSTGA